MVKQQLLNKKTTNIKHYTSSPCSLLIWGHLIHNFQMLRTGKVAAHSFFGPKTKEKQCGLAVILHSISMLFCRVLLETDEKKLGLQASSCYSNNQPVIVRDVLALAPIYQKVDEVAQQPRRVVLLDLHITYVGLFNALANLCPSPKPFTSLFERP